MTPTTGPRRPSARARSSGLVRALLFDFDGVIADTENHHVAAWQRTFALMGLTVDDATCARSMEQDDRVFLTEALTRRQIDDGDVDGWVRRKQELTLTLLRDAPRVYPGVAEIVARLAEKIPLAIITTTWRANVESVLASAGLSGAFALIVGKEDVSAAKPDPQPYQLAVSKLGIKPFQAVALEDSPSGIASALAAGVRAVAVGHRRAHGDWVQSAPYLADLRTTDEVLDLIGIR